MSANPFGSFSNTLGGLGTFGNALSGAGAESFGNSLSGAGDVSSSQIAAQGPDMNVSWEDLTKSPAFSNYSNLYNDLPYQNANYSDALIDWGKFGVNQNIPMGGINSQDWASGLPQWDSGKPMYITPGDEWRPGVMTPEYEQYAQQVAASRANPHYGDISLSGNTLNYKGSPFTQLYKADRDPSEAMGAVDPRVQLIMNDAKGWNDPLSNWLQGQGIEGVNEIMGRLNYRARNGDSSAAGFDPQAYYVSRLGADAADVLRADPAAISQTQANWSNYMSPGAQSDRADAMFGGGGFLGDLGPLSSIAAMIPGPWQPFAMALNAANSLDSGNILGALMSGAGAIGGFGGLDVGGADFFGEGTAGAFSDWGSIGSPLSDYSSLAADGLGGYAPEAFDMAAYDFPTDINGALQFDDAMQQGTGLNSPDAPWNSLSREYNQLMAENPLLEQGVKYGPKAYKTLSAKGAKEDVVKKYLSDKSSEAAARQEERSNQARGVKSKRRKISALAGV